MGQTLKLAIHMVYSMHWVPTGAI